MEAISWRPTLRGLNAAILLKMDHSQGPIAASEPSSSDLENSLSTDTEPCPTDLPIDLRHALGATSWRRLHRDQPPQVGWRQTEVCQRTFSGGKVLLHFATAW